MDLLIERLRASGVEWSPENYTAHQVRGLQFIAPASMPLPELRMMPCKGTGVIICADDVVFPGKVSLNGHDNLVFIDQGCDLKSSVIDVSADNGTVLIGARTRALNGANVKLANAGLISIGRECYLSRHAIVSNSDGHAIYDLATGDRRNPDRDVHLGDRVFLEQSARVGKGAHVGDGCFIGEMSVVSGNIPPNCYYAGVPARLIASDIRWEKPHD